MASSVSIFTVVALFSIPQVLLATKVPTWHLPSPDASKPLGGFKFLQNITQVEVYHAIPDVGTYNHAAMISYLPNDRRIFLTWKNSPVDEDSPGQRVLYAQTFDGKTWTPDSDGTNVVFPNISTSSNPAALFAEPTLFFE